MPERVVTRRDWLRAATERLMRVRFDGAPVAGESAVRPDGGVGVDSPRLSAELLLRHVLGISRVELATRPESAVPAAALTRLEGLLRRRVQGEPVAYLIGQREFFGRDFIVTPATLIPRPETEILVETALEALPAAGVAFADLGTGSGCIAVTLCAERPGWRGIALDRSGRALSVAGRNARRHDTAGRLAFVRGDFLAPCLAPESLDLVVSNPPYVSLTEYAALSPEVRDFEPVTALVPSFADDGGRRARHHHHPAPEKAPGHTPGEQGSGEKAPGAEVPEKEAGDEEAAAALAHLRAVAEAARTAQKAGGRLLMEHGWDQGAAIRLWLERHGWEDVRQYADLSGKDRAIGARKPGRPILSKPQCGEKHTVVPCAHFGFGMKNQ